MKEQHKKESPILSLLGMGGGGGSGLQGGAGFSASGGDAEYTYNGNKIQNRHIVTRDFPSVGHDAGPIVQRYDLKHIQRTVKDCFVRMQCLKFKLWILEFLSEELSSHQSKYKYGKYHEQDHPSHRRECTLNCADQNTKTSHES